MCAFFTNHLTKYTKHLSDHFKKIPDGPEMDEYKEKRKEFDKDFPNVLATINGGSSLDIIQLDVENSKIEELLEEATNTVERM